MEKVKNVLLTGGKAALNSAVELGCSVVQLFTRLANTPGSSCAIRSAPCPGSTAGC